MKKFLFLLTPIAFAVPAHAHFLWAQTDTNHSRVNLYFGEGTDDLIDGVKPEVLQKAVLWKPNGQKISTSLSGGAYRAPLVKGTQVYGAYQSWGVLDRTEGGRGVFRLEYYAKAATELSKAGFSAKLPFEIFARRAGNEAVVTLKRGKQLVADSDVSVLLPEKKDETKLHTDAQGQVHFPLAGNGTYALRALVIDNVPGELDGKKYPLTRTWTTLTFHVTDAPAPAKTVAATTTAAAPAKPEAMGNPNADPKAYALLKAAHENRQVMPDNFPGFQADIVYTDGDATKSGKLVYQRQGKTEINVAGLSDDDKDWLEDKVMNLIGHRRGGDFAKGDGKNPLSLVAGDNNWFGQLIKVNDGMGSEYRVRDGEVTEVTRTMGGSTFTISVIETMNADAGKYLANHFEVAYRDAKTNALQKVEGYHDSYAQIDGVWIPTGRTVLDVGDKTSPRVRDIRFRNIEVLKPVQVAALAPAEKTP